RGNDERRSWLPVSSPALTPGDRASTPASGGFFSNDLAGLSSSKRWLLQTCLAGFVSGMRWLPQHRSWPAFHLTFIAHLRFSSFLFRCVPVECSIRHPTVISEPVKSTASLLLSHLVLLCFRQGMWFCAVTRGCILHHLGFYGWAV
ncbi:unnamed protein product, partial [Brassica rapa subsp. trilocularis]